MNNKIHSIILKAVPLLSDPHIGSPAIRPAGDCALSLSDQSSITGPGARAGAVWRIKRTIEIFSGHLRRGYAVQPAQNTPRRRAGDSEQSRYVASGRVAQPPALGAFFSEFALCSARRNTHLSGRLWLTCSQCIAPPDANLRALWHAPAICVLLGDHSKSQSTRRSTDRTADVPD